MGKKIDNLHWNKYCPADTVDQGIYLCKYDEDEIRFLTYDLVWGWTADWDDYDCPHFVYDWYLEYAKVDQEDIEEVKKELAQIKRKKEREWEAEFVQLLKEYPESNRFTVNEDWDDADEVEGWY